MVWENCLSGTEETVFWRNCVSFLVQNTLPAHEFDKLSPGGKENDGVFLIGVKEVILPLQFKLPHSDSHGFSSLRFISHRR